MERRWKRNVVSRVSSVIVVTRLLLQTYRFRAVGDFARLYLGQLAQFFHRQSNSALSSKSVATTQLVKDRASQPLIRHAQHYGLAAWRSG